MHRACGVKRGKKILMGLADEPDWIVHAVGSHSQFWSKEKKGQNYMRSRIKDQTRGLRTHYETVTLMRV